MLPVPAMSQEEPDIGEIAEELEGVPKDELEAQIIRAMQRWEDGLAEQAQEWHDRSSDSEGAYRQGIARFFGLDEEQISRDVSSRWQRNISRVSAEDFQEGVRGRGPTWFLNIYRAFADHEPPQEMKDLARRINELRAQQEDQSEEEEDQTEEE